MCWNIFGVVKYSWVVSKSSVWNLNILFFFFFCRSPLRMWRRRTLSSLNSVPSSSQKMWRMSWSRISLRSCSSCKWKTPFWVTISTVLQRLRCFWPPIQCRPNLVISARKSTGLDTWPQIASCPNGESYRTGLTGACAPGSILPPLLIGIWFWITVKGLETLEMSFCPSCCLIAGF